MTRGPGRHPNKIDEGAHNEGSVNDEAEASAARCAYVTSTASNDNKAATSAIKAGAYDEGSNGDEAGASAARCAYAASVAANNNKAVASTARRARAVNSAPMHGRGKEIGKGTHKRAPLTIRPRRAPQGTRTQHAPPPPLGAARGHSGPMHGRGRRHRQRGLRRGLWQQQGRGEHLEAWVCKRCLRG